MKKLWLKGLMSVLLLLATGPLEKAGALSLNDLVLNGTITASALWGPGDFTNLGPEKKLVEYLNDTSYFGSFGGSAEFKYFSKAENGKETESTIHFGYDFGLSYTSNDKPNENLGSFTFSWSGSPLPVTFDLVFLLKAGDDFALYFFDNFELTQYPTTASGTYKVSFTNNGGQYPALSHLSVFGRQEPTQPVPEPATMLLFGSGIIGLAAVARRKKR